MIYAVRRLTDGLIKIGYSYNPFERAYGIGRKDVTELFAIWEGGPKEESDAHIALHKSNSNHNPRRGEREWFRPTRSVLTYINRKAIFKRRRPKEWQGKPSGD